VSLSKKKIFRNTVHSQHHEIKLVHRSSVQWKWNSEKMCLSRSLKMPSSLTQWRWMARRAKQRRRRPGQSPIVERRDGVVTRADVDAERSRLLCHWKTPRWVYSSHRSNFS